jgi:hypothetical protein
MIHKFKMRFVDRRLRWGVWLAGGDEVTGTLQFMQHAMVAEEPSKEKTAQQDRRLGS